MTADSESETKMPEEKGRLYVKSSTGENLLLGVLVSSITFSSREYDFTAGVSTPQLIVCDDVSGRFEVDITELVKQQETMNVVIRAEYDYKHIKCKLKPIVKPYGKKFRRSTYGR